MLRIRKFEEKTLLMYSQQKIRGFCHVYIGQEAIAAGIKSALKPEDCLVTAYRQHGLALMKKVVVPDLVWLNYSVNKLVASKAKVVLCTSFQRT